MQFIREIYAAKKAAGKPVISFEFFPPKTPEGEHVLLEKTIPALKQLNPDYCSVTYGAGGGTRDKTLKIVGHIQGRHQLVALAHLTCVNHTRAQINELVTQIRALGCRNILALRGDPPGGGEFVKTEGGFEFAFELVELIHRIGGFSIGVAGFPEGHPACREGRYVDWQHLKHKIERGADFVLTQFFFDNGCFLEFRDYLTNKLGVRVPIVPGVIPILNTGQIKKFTQLAGASIPAGLAARLDQLGEDSDAVTEFGIEYATKQCDELLHAGVPGIHFYVLNKSYSVTRILRNLGLA